MRTWMPWAALAVLVLQTPVHAQDPLQCEAMRAAMEQAGEDEFERLETPRVIEFTLGVKFGSGVELWTTPTDVTYDYTDSKGGAARLEMPFFNSTAAGYTASFGVTGELRVVEHLGLEIGAFFTRHKLMQPAVWSYQYLEGGKLTEFYTQTDQTMTFVKFRLPILVKGIIQASERVRVWLGVGPELAWGLHSSASYEYDEAPAGPPSAFTTLDVRDVDDVGFLTGAGVVIDAGVVQIPIELRFTYNFSQAARYFDRIAFDQMPSPSVDYPTRGTLNGRNSMYAQLLVGATYDL
jgi:hypothetical protein